MAQESNVIERAPQVKRAEAGAGLRDMLETMEQGVRGTLRSTAAAITDTVEGAQARVETAVRSVRGAAHDSGAAVGRVLDLAAHVRRHPWLMVGGAVLLGWAVAGLVGRWRR